MSHLLSKKKNGLQGKTNDIVTLTLIPVIEIHKNSGAFVKIKKKIQSYAKRQSDS